MAQRAVIRGARPPRAARGAAWLQRALALVAFALGGCASAPMLPDGAAVPAVAQPGAPLAPEIATGRTARQLSPPARDMVVAAHPLAAQAGARMLARGGSAIDAAIAAQMVLNVVEPQSSGIGGGGFLLHLDGSSATLSAWDGRETAPTAVTPGIFLGPDGRPRRFPELADSGLSVGAPGLLRMLEAAHRRHGRLPWATLFEAAIRTAEDGFEVSARLHRSLVAAASRICASRSAALFMQPGSCAPAPAGSRLRNPALARTFRAIAAGGADAFHEGPIARDIVAAVQAHPLRPGRLTQEDLRNYRARERKPLCGPYRGYRICSVPAPSSGGIALLQTLGILEHFELRALAPEGVEAVHLITEAWRLAYADRGRHVADDDFVPVPIAGLLDPRYLAQRAALIRRDASMGTPVAGAPDGAGEHGDEPPRFGPPSTTHLSVVDRDGNAVSMTTSIEHAFGSLLSAGGFLLNNQLTDFAFVPADRTGRALANRIEPGKRPRSTMTPAMVFAPDGSLVAVIGSPGGGAIVNYVTKALVAMIDWELDVQQAVDLPNFGAMASAATFLERGTALEALAPALKRLGHRVLLIDLTSGLHGVARTADGRWVGGADPRREGAARSSTR